ncbi:hypothetical protein SNEBB_003402 [Seison nebaliae]|nr:hypothetical protein SNEBB_003402 [Seison nebaliae]
MAPFKYLILSMRPNVSDKSNYDEYGYRIKSNAKIGEGDEEEEEDDIGHERSEFEKNKDVDRKRHMNKLKSVHELNWLAKLEFTVGSSCQNILLETSNNLADKTLYQPPFSLSALKQFQINARDDNNFLSNLILKNRYERNNDRNGKSSVDEVVCGGIPEKFRAQLWYWLTNASTKEKSSTSTYSDYFKLMKRHEASQKDNWDNIELDLLRTIPTHPCFNSMNAVGVSKLRNILRVLAFVYEDMGYCQGVAMVVAQLLLVMEEEYVFWIMCSIIENVLPAAYYSRKVQGLQIDQLLLRDLISKFYPDLDKIFNKFQIELSLVTIGWFLTLYSNSFTHSSLIHRIWDWLFFEGHLVLFYVALGLLAYSMDKLLSYETSTDIYQHLTDLPSSIDNVDLLLHLSIIARNTFSPDRLMRTRQNYLMKAIGDNNDISDEAFVGQKRLEMIRNRMPLKSLFMTQRQRHRSEPNLKDNIVTQRLHPLENPYQKQKINSNNNTNNNHNMGDYEKINKNVHQTELLVNLRQAILLVCDHFQRLNPKRYRNIKLTPDYSTSSHLMDIQEWGTPAKVTIDLQRLIGKDEKQTNNSSSNHHSSTSTKDEEDDDVFNDDGIRKSDDSSENTFRSRHRSYSSDMAPKRSSMLLTKKELINKKSMTSQFDTVNRYLMRNNDLNRMCVVNPCTRRIRIAKAILPFESKESDELSFIPTDIIFVTSMKDEHCWKGISERTGNNGWFPSNYVELVDTNGKEYCKAGDDSIEPLIAHVVRDRLASAIRAIFMNGIIQSTFHVKAVHPWLFIREAASQIISKNLNMVQSRLLLCKTFKLDEDYIVLSPTELLYRCVEAIEYSHNATGMKMDVKLRSLICLGLNKKALHLWLECLCSCKSIVKKWYQPHSYIRSPGWVQVKCDLRILAQFAFHLSRDWEIPTESYNKFLLELKKKKMNRLQVTKKKMMMMMSSTTRPTSNEIESTLGLFPRFSSSTKDNIILPTSSSSSSIVNNGTSGSTKESEENVDDSNSKLLAAQALNGSVQDILVKHHLFSWD